jgi:hypothetical protein
MHIVIDQHIETSLDAMLYTVLAEKPESTESARQRWWCAGVLMFVSLLFTRI